MAEDGNRENGYNQTDNVLSETDKAHWALYARYLSDESLWSNSVRQTINECIQKRPPDMLWHYCSMTSFEAICRSGKIFMSDLGSMNDYREGQWLRGQIALRAGANARVFLTFLERTRIDFMLGPFVVSLSEEGDLLSQWRAYASGGRGVALGVRPDTLATPVYQIVANQKAGHCVLANVIYDPDIQESVVQKIVDVINGLIRDTGTDVPFNEAHPFTMYAAYINMYLHFIEPIFKNPAFKEEKEWRLIYFPKSSLMDSWREPSSIYLSDENDKEKLKFRILPDDVVQYFTFPELESLNSMIKGVFLGPLNRTKTFPLALFFAGGWHLGVLYSPLGGHIALRLQAVPWGRRSVYIDDRKSPTRHHASRKEAKGRDHLIVPENARRSGKARAFQGGDPG
jgi:hypothetical protein